MLVQLSLNVAQKPCCWLLLANNKLILHCESLKDAMYQKNVTYEKRVRCGYTTSMLIQVRDFANIASASCCVGNSTEVLREITDSSNLQTSKFEGSSSNFAGLLTLAAPRKQHKQSEFPLLSSNNSIFFNTKQSLSESLHHYHHHHYLYSNRWDPFMNILFYIIVKPIYLHLWNRYKTIKDY